MLYTASTAAAADLSRTVLRLPPHDAACLPLCLPAIRSHCIAGLQLASVAYNLFVLLLCSRAHNVGPAQYAGGCGRSWSAASMPKCEMRCELRFLFVTDIESDQGWPGRWISLTIFRLHSFLQHVSCQLITE
jgi:hypothetical protein